MYMQVFTAHVEDGLIVPEEGIEVPDGARVTVFTSGPEEAIELMVSAEQDLQDALAAAQEDGEVDLEDFLKTPER